MEDAAPGSPQRQATQEAEALRTKGNEFFRKGEFEQAKVAYSRGLILDPMNALLWSNRSATHLALDNPFFALYDAHQLYLLKPTWEKTLYRLGMANLRLPERAAAERARICFGSGLLLAPDSKDMKGGWMEASRLLLERKARPPFKIRDWVDAREMCKTEERMAECEARMKGVELYSVTPPERDITLAGNPKAKRFFDMLCMGRLVEVRDVEGAGRGLFARCDFKKGMLILQEEPVLACNIQETGCLRCFKPLRRKRLRCGGCQRCFCSPRCKSLSKEHRFLCAAKDQLSELLAWIKECSMSSSGKSHLLMAQAIAIAMQRELLLSPFEIEEIGHLKIGQHNGHPLRDSGHFVERLQQLFGISSLSWLNAEWHYYATQIIQVRDTACQRIFIHTSRTTRSRSRLASTTHGCTSEGAGMRCILW